MHTQHKTLPVIGICLAVLIACPAPSFAQNSGDPTFREIKNQEGYIVDLRELIKRSKDKIEDVNEKLKEQARRRRNQQREEKAREYYEKAMRFSDEGKLKEAQQLWEKAIKITEHPEMRGYIRESTRRTKEQEKALREAEQQRLKRLEVERGYSASEVEQTYDEAVRLFKKKLWVDAKDKFVAVDEMFPDHKATRSYLMVIEQEIQKEQEKLINETLKEEAKKAIKGKEEWRRDLEKKEKMKREELEAQAEVVYQDAVKLYDAGQFEKAKRRFNEVEWIIPDYRSTLQYLARIDDDIAKNESQSVDDREQLLLQQLEDARMEKLKEREMALKNLQEEEQRRLRRLEEEANFMYEAAMNLFNQQDFEKAKEKFLDIERQFPSYRETLTYISRINDKLEEQKEQERLRLQREMEQLEREKAQREQEERERQIALQKKAEEERRKQMEEEAQILYDAGVAYYDKKFFLPAQEKFRQVRELVPGFRSTEKYLTRISQTLKQDEEVPVEKAADREEQDRIERKALKKQAASVYREAVHLYKQGNLAEAKTEFMRVQKLLPDYRRTERYLKRIAEESAKSKTVSSEDVIPETREAVVEQVSQDKTARETVQEKVSRDELKRIYQEALEAYKQKDYEAAQQKFRDVADIDPDYRSTGRYLEITAQRIAEVRNQMEKTQAERLGKDPAPAGEIPLNANKEQVVQKADMERREKLAAEAEAKYVQAVDFYNAGNYFEAKLKFIQVEALYPDYKKTAIYLNRIDQDISKQQTALSSSSGKSGGQPTFEERNGCGGKLTMDECYAMLRGNTEAMFKQGVGYYNDKKYAAAREKFEDILRLEPGHKDASQYLKKTDDMIREDLRREQKVLEEEFYQKDITVKELQEQQQRDAKRKDEVQDWEKRYADRIAMLKAKEEFLSELKGEQYEDYRKRLEKEYEELERAKKDRRYYKTLRQQAYKKRLREERAERKRELAERKRVAQLRERQLRIKEREEMMAKQKVEDQRSLVENLQEEKIAAEEKAVEETQKEEEELVTHLEALKKEELEYKRRAELLAQKIEDEQKKLNERIAQRLTAVEEEFASVDHELEQLKYLEEQSEKAAAERKEIEEAKIDDLPPEVAVKLASLEDAEYEQFKDKIARKAAVKEYRELKANQEDLIARQRVILDEEQEKISRVLEKKEQQTYNRWSSDISAIYKDAQRLFKDGYYQGAKSKFMLCDTMQPGYRSARSYVNKIDRMMADEERYQQRLKEKAEARARKEAIQQKREEERQKRLEEKSLAAAAKDAAAEEGKPQENKTAVSEDVQPMQSEEMKKAAQAALDKQRAENEERLAKERENARAEIEAKNTEEAARLEQEEKLARIQAKELEEKSRAEENERLQLEKEQARKEREMAKQEERRRRDELAKLKKQIAETYKDANRLFRAEQRDMALKEYSKVENLLNNEALDVTDKAKWLSRIEAQRGKIEDLNERERLRQERLAKEREERLAREERERQDRLEREERERQEQLAREERMREEQKQKELQELQKKIREDEERLAREKEEIERKRLAEEAKAREREAQEARRAALEQEREEARVRDEEMNKTKQQQAAAKTVESESVLSTAADASTGVEEARQLRISEEERRRELERLLKERQQEIAEERERVRKEFEESLGQMYVRGEKMMKEEKFRESLRIFQEINRLSPGYKNVAQHLDTLQEMDVVTVSPRPLAPSEKISTPFPPAAATINLNPERLDAVTSALDELENNINSDE